jgi:hypothetical protein
MKITADTNTFIAVALNKPEKGKIIGHIFIEGSAKADSA